MLPSVCIMIAADYIIKGECVQLLEVLRNLENERKAPRELHQVLSR